MIVIDASAVLEVLLRTPKAERIERRALHAGESLHAPHLLDLEVVNAIRRSEAGEILSAGRARQAVTDFRDLDVSRYPHQPMLSRIWELRGNLSAYDAAYVALAECLRAPLLTCDARLAAAPTHRARVEVF